jgi:large subunit ribosomal protein L9
MKVVLLDNVKSVGNVGDVVNVSPGHARNLLVPNGLALVADEGNKKSIEQQRKMLAKKVAEHKATAEAMQKKVDGLVLEFVKKVGQNGKLFGSITTRELSDELGKKGVEVERRLLTVSKPIKSVGSFDVKASLFEGVAANFQVKVVMSPEQEEEMKRKQAAAEKRAAEKKAKAAEEATEEASEEVKSEDQALDEEVNEILRS